MKGNPRDLSPEALIKLQEERINASLKSSESKDDQQLDPNNMTIDDLKTLAFKNKAKALVIVQKVLKEYLRPKVVIDVSELKDLVNINELIAKSLEDSKVDDKGLQILIQQMFQTYSDTSAAQPVTPSEKKIDIVEMLNGKD